MAVEKAPYMTYSEITSYAEVIDNGSEIPVFIVKSNNTVNEDEITDKKISEIKSYKKFKELFSIPTNETEYNSLGEATKELDVLIKDFFVENAMYGQNDDYGLSIPHIYIIDVGSNPTLQHYKNALTVSGRKRDASMVVFPNTEDVAFMSELKNILVEQTKSGLLRIAYFAVSGQGELTTKLAKGDILVPTTGADTYTEVIEGYLNNNKFYETKTDSSTYSDEITPKATAIYLNIGNTESPKDAYVYSEETYTSINTTRSSALIFETDANYKFIIPSTKDEVGGSTETHAQYAKRIAFISQAVNSSRVGIVDKTLFAKTIARICSTPYYIEPGYLPYMSVSLGTFKERSDDERDELFGNGLIFGEDDYTLSNVTPRICTAVSTAWGIEDHDARVTDALLHARRNVDHHVRRILKILAPQLKRNETSVTLRHVQNQVDLYLDSELSKGTIQEYVVSVGESSYNPYKLLVKGKIVPVNSTLAIEFENTIGSPYAIASDYV